MKHNLKITTILLSMFIIAQLIGIYVINADPFTVQKEINGTVQEVDNSYLLWINPPKAETQGEFTQLFVNIIIAFLLAIVILILLMKFRVSVFLKIWFFLVVSIALLLSFLALMKLLPFEINVRTSFIFSLILAVLLASLKFFGRNFLVHNFTELLIYPGIATVFVPLLNVWTIAALLVLISVYDIWAVWHSGIMQKMAKYQIDTLKVFSGFFVPYVSKKVKQQISRWKKTLSRSQLKKKKIKVNVAILGGGDIVFPIITAGVMLKTLGLGSAFFVIVGATLGLSYLFIAAEKRKFYPAMPFITAGILVGILASYLIL